MTDLIKAYTKLDPNYPGYVNFSRDTDGAVVVTVRADPKIVHDGAYICGYARDKGQLGRCTPGDDHCNNYCNMAPEKGAMQPHPAACEQVICGATAAVKLSAAEWDDVRAGLVA